MIIEDYLKYDTFSKINLKDPFFDSLKSDYAEFESWFLRKSSDYAYYFEDNQGLIQAFLYLKIEEEELTDVIPKLPYKKRIKIGTLKINPHGTRLGERFLKKAFDYAIVNNISELYVTVFEKHQALIELFHKYGFIQSGIKSTANGDELVFIKSLEDECFTDALLNYPLVKLGGQMPYLLAIYPRFHTKLFPDSILTTETFDVVQDVSYTNSIEKIYIGYAPGLSRLRPNDPIIIYRTSDNKGPAEYRSVATSLCTVIETRSKDSFNNVEEYLSYCGNYTVFDDKTLRNAFNNSNMYVIKMVYNQAFKHRVIRQELADECGLMRNARWSIISLEHDQFNCILEKGGINESFIID